MFNLSDKETIRACRDVLVEFYRADRKNFIHLFLQRKPAHIAKAYSGPLAQARIIENIKDGAYPLLRIFPIRGRFIATDYLVPRKFDNVFAIQVDESAYFARNLSVAEGDIVLDMFTGSGIYPIFCAENAKKIYAVDISKKALAYARFNAILNNVESKITFLNGDMFDAIRPGKFDLITASPPCVPTPLTNRVEALFADSGIDGLKYPSRFLTQATKYLARGGRLQMYLGVVGDKERPLIEEQLVSMFQKERVKIELNMLHNRSVRLETLIRKKYLDPFSFRYRLGPGELRRWSAHLKGRGYSHFYYCLVSIHSSNAFEIITKRPDRDLKKDLYMTGDLGLYSPGRISKLLREFCD